MEKDYSKVGAPFDFLGHLSQTQKEAFYTWMDARNPKLLEAEKWWRIRAQQLRKTAGVQEKWFQEVNDEHMAPRFDKQPWEPGPDGHRLYAVSDDRLPSVCVSRMKEIFQEQLERDDEGMFQLNHLRILIEKAEDRAQMMHESKAKMVALRADLDRYFNSGDYKEALVQDKTNLYKGKPRYRTHQLNPPTPWEMENANTPQP